MQVHDRLKHRQFRSPAEEALITLLVAAGQLTQRLNDLCRTHGITHDQYNILRILRGAHPEGHPRFEIASRLVSRAPDVTRLIDRLERQGLVERGWSPTNRRHSVARITPAGLELLAALDPAVERLHDETVEGISGEELRTLARICGRMVR